MRNVSAPRNHLLICALALILSLLLACGGEGAAEPGEQGQGAQPAGTTSGQAAEETPAPTRVAGTGAAVSTTRPVSTAHPRVPGSRGYAGSHRHGNGCRHSRGNSTQRTIHPATHGHGRANPSAHAHTRTQRPAVPGGLVPGPRDPLSRSRHRRPTGRRSSPCSTPPAGRAGTGAASGPAAVPSESGTGSRPTTAAG